LGGPAMTILKPLTPELWHVGRCYRRTVCGGKTRVARAARVCVST